MSSAILPAASHGKDSHGQTPHPIHGAESRGRAPNHAVAHSSSAHAHPHAAPAPVPTPSRWGWWVALLMIVVGGLVVWAWAERSAPHLSGADLVRDFRLAVTGAPLPAPHGGVTIRTLSSGGVTVVSAEGVPPKVCVSAAWDLVKDGTISVNGITPPRISAARLAELCNVNHEATLVWTPEPSE